MKKTVDVATLIKDPVDFACKMLIKPDGSPLVPHSGQEQLLHSIKALTVCCCGRQFGKSVAMAMYACWYAATHSHRQVYIIAPTLDQSRIIFNEIAFQFRNSRLKSLVDGKINEYPFPKIKLLNGTEIHGRGANSPQFLRGKKCHLAIVDEAAFCKDKTLTDVVEPFMTVTGKEKDSGIIYISTPFGLGAFYDYYQDALSCIDSSMIAHHFTSMDNPHADKAFLERVKNRYGEDSLTWRTEYLAEFVDDDLSVFPSQLIKWAYEHYPYKEDNDAENPVFPVAAKEQHKYVMGVDLANVRDYFVSTVLDITNPELVPLVHMTRLQKRGYKEYKRIIRAEHHQYNNAEVLLDATSLGESVAEDLEDIQAEGYKFSTQSKAEIVHELQRMFAEHRIAIPYDREIISELRNFQYSFSAGKVLRMEAVKGHDDIVMSLALAAHLACIPRSLGVFSSVDIAPKPPKPPKHQAGYDPFKELFEHVINNESH